jgi:hypothetical protein
MEAFEMKISDDFDVLCRVIGNASPGDRKVLLEYMQMGICVMLTDCNATGVESLLRQLTSGAREWNDADAMMAIETMCVNIRESIIPLLNTNPVETTIHNLTHDEIMMEMANGSDTDTSAPSASMDEIMIDANEIP